MKKLLFITALFLISINAQTNKPVIDKDIPRLEKQEFATRLIVQGKPFLILASETGNSNASNLNYFNSILPEVVKMHLNTLLVPVYRELIESSKRNGKNAEIKNE